jgi:hypothetical protein
MTFFDDQLLNYPSLCVPLQYCEDLSPPSRKEPSVKKLCEVRFTSPTPFRELPVETNAENRKVRRFNFDVVMSSYGSSVDFEVFLGSERLASQNVAVVFEEPEQDVLNLGSRPASDSAPRPSSVGHEHTQGQSQNQTAPIPPVPRVIPPPIPRSQPPPIPQPHRSNGPFTPELEGDQPHARAPVRPPKTPFSPDSYGPAPGESSSSNSLRIPSSAPSSLPLRLQLSVDQPPYGESSAPSSSSAPVTAKNPLIQSKRSSFFGSLRKKDSAVSLRMPRLGKDKHGGSRLRIGSD